MKQVLFVDDERRVLEGLGRMLRVMRHEWDMTFIEDPCEAVALLPNANFDAIVVDMRMPMMDGIALLEKARELKPGMARIVLSGHAEPEAALRSVGLAHQFLAKPCDAETVRKTIARACELRHLLHEAGLADVVCKLGRLPSLPRLYQAITEEMGREDVSLKRVASIVSEDIAMTAKILQLVNSAFFGLGRRVGNVEQAVSYLGIDVIRSLVASHAAFTAFDVEDLEFYDSLWRHSSMTGVLAKKIAEQVTADPIMHGEAVQAGMLHHIGALVLAARLPDRYREVRAVADGERAAAERERELFGCDHARVGAYLMGLWGLSDRIVEAIAYHDGPSQCSYREVSPLTAVHAASGLLREALDVGAADLDIEYLAGVGCLERVPEWREQAREIAARKDENHD